MDLCNIQYGYAFDSAAFTDEEAYPQLARIRDVKRGFSETYYKGEYPKEYVLSKGDLLIGMDGEFNIARWKTEGALLNQRVCKVTAKAGTDEEYLRFALSKILKEIEGRTAFVTVKHLSTKELSRVEFDVPEYTEQKHISRTLSLLESIIAERQAELFKLDELVKARFVELFGDPKINEKNWDTGVVSQFYEVKGGKRIPKGMGYADGITAHPYLRATDMKNETILDDDIHYIDEDVFEKIKRYTVKGGDIYLTNVGVNLGMAGVIPDRYDGANLTENAVKLVPKTDAVLDGLFLAHYINSPGIQDYINERKMSVGVPKLAIFRIETMPLILPPMDLQIGFINFCKQVDKSKVAVQKALNEAQLLFDSLMQEYFG